ncbi:hypothetical protein Mal48_11400 [Thalassoglobus polymorphus]|uniref:Uncharacterized protein n=1 Tax=Thalassoglobus polymorphus TaxID=2527994 RepID=A0A517QJU1_9PLAN|nr:hypothetical protein Mal48_11400 [Thalassoglobus polymorphus]
MKTNIGFAVVACVVLETAALNKTPEAKPSISAPGPVLNGQFSLTISIENAATSLFTSGGYTQNVQREDDNPTREVAPDESGKLFEHINSFNCCQGRFNSLVPGFTTCTV